MRSIECRKVRTAYPTWLFVAAQNAERYVQRALRGWQKKK